MKKAGKIWRLGAFEIVKDLAAKGAQGKLYVGRAIEAAFPGIHPGDLVALKVMPDHGDDAERDFKRLVRRTNALIAASNPGIVRYYGCFATSQGFEDVHVLVMELLRGQTLEERLKSNKLGLDADEVLRIIRSCAGALVICAEHGLVHRDIKPSNIFLCDDGSAKLIDFEIARQDGASRTTTESGAMRGTVDYMAPDFHPDFRPDRGFRGDECSDVFSLTVCLYEMLAGSRPYAAGGAMGEQSMMAFFQRWTKVEGVDVSKALKIESFRIHALAHVQKVIRKGLSPERSGRYQTYREFAAALDGVVLREIASPTTAYELLRCVGKGGFGVVFRGRRKSDGLAVAIKILLKPEYSERFIREAKTLSRFNDDRLVSFVEYFRTARAASETHFIVMQFLEGMPGSSLRDRIAAANDRHLHLPPREIATAFMRFAGGLGVMHGAGIVHRDIKPANLYMPEGGADRASVMDLGVVKTEETHTQGSLPGTLDYMAPEMALGSSRGSAAVDIYALGLCLHEALTGEPAFPRLKRGGDGLAEFYRRAKAGDRPDVSRLDGRPAWRALVTAMTEPDPRRRIGNCSEVVRLLSQIPETELSDPEEARRSRRADGDMWTEGVPLGREVGLSGELTTAGRDTANAAPSSRRPERGSARPAAFEAAAPKRRSRISLPVTEEVEGGSDAAEPPNGKEANALIQDAAVRPNDVETIDEAKGALQGSGAFAAAGANTKTPEPDALAVGGTTIPVPKGDRRAVAAETPAEDETNAPIPDGETRAEVVEARAGEETRVGMLDGETRAEVAEARAGEETRVGMPDGETRAGVAETRAGEETRVAVSETRAEADGTRATVATSSLDGTLADVTRTRAEADGTRATVATSSLDGTLADVTRTRATLAASDFGLEKNSSGGELHGKKKPEPTQKPKPEPPRQPKQETRPQARPQPSRKTDSDTQSRQGRAPYPKPEQSVVVRTSKSKPLAAALFIIAIGAAFGAAFYLKYKADQRDRTPPDIPPEPPHAGPVVLPPVGDAIAEAENALRAAMGKLGSEATALRADITKANDLADSRKEAKSITAAMDAALAKAAKTNGVADGEVYRNVVAQQNEIANSLDEAIVSRQNDIAEEARKAAISAAEKVLDEAMGKQEATVGDLCATIAKAENLTQCNEQVAEVKAAIDDALDAAAKTAGVSERETYRNAAAKRDEIAKALDDAIALRKNALAGIAAIAEAEDTLGKAMSDLKAIADTLCIDIGKADDLTESRKKVKEIDDAIYGVLATAARTAGVAEGAAYRNASDKRVRIANSLDNAIASRENELGILAAIAKAEKALDDAMRKQKADADTLLVAIAKADDLAGSRREAKNITNAMDAALVTAAKTAGVAERDVYRDARMKRDEIATDLGNAIARRQETIDEAGRHANAEERVREATRSVEAIDKLVKGISDRVSYDNAKQKVEAYSVPADTGYADLDKQLAGLRGRLSSIKGLDQLAKPATVKVMNNGGERIIVSCGSEKKSIPSGGSVLFERDVWRDASFNAKAEGVAALDYVTEDKTASVKGGGSEVSIAFNLAYKGDPELKVHNGNEFNIRATVGGDSIDIQAGATATFAGKPRGKLDVSFSCDAAYAIAGANFVSVEMGDAGTMKTVGAPALQRNPRRIRIVNPLGDKVTWRISADGIAPKLLTGDAVELELPEGVGQVTAVPDPPKPLRNGQEPMPEYETQWFDVSGVRNGEKREFELPLKVIPSNRAANIRSFGSSSASIKGWFWTEPGKSLDTSPDVVEAEYEVLKSRIETALKNADTYTQPGQWLGATDPMCRIVAGRYRALRMKDAALVGKWRNMLEACKGKLKDFAHRKNYDELVQTLNVIMPALDADATSR